MVIGITGGVGSGKSTVLSFIQYNYDCIILLTDDIAKQLQKPGEISYNLIVEHFGNTILNIDKTINSKELAKIVFSNKQELEHLNSFCHPYVIEYVIEKIKENPNKLIFIESALLLDTHLKNICDEIWYIQTDITLRKERLKNGRNYSDEKIESMFKNQDKEEKFVKFCDVIIKNNKIMEMEELVTKRLREILC